MECGQKLESGRERASVWRPIWKICPLSLKNEVLPLSRRKYSE